ncbi:hypothetical protein [Robiginitalea sp. SC105]|uniref:hypothetical protein n=1 Tax=Robiginitalea sp. SC105 TaxID=2762332 RepID=UPI00163B07C7|nr:hypothetical protein [Robiginitalea sp. SC105]MBC2838879.1 hypothetical protein [Robiginitalea sp. SC105]
MFAFKLLNTSDHIPKIRLGIKFLTFLSIYLIHPSLAFGQIAFEEPDKEQISIGQIGNINAHITEIGPDRLALSWKIIDLEATGSDNIFMAYDRETHKVEFEATYDELEALKVWIEERQKTKTGGTVNLGEWEVTYVQSALGIPVFSWTGPTGNFESAINSEMRMRLMTRRYLEGAIEEYKLRQAKEAERDARRKAREERRKSKNMKDDGDIKRNKMF